MLAVRLASGAQQRLFAEQRSRTENGEGDHLAVRRRWPNGDPALLDEVQRVAGVTLVEQDLTLAKRPAVHAREDRPSILLVELGEQLELHGLHSTERVATDTFVVCRW